MQKPGGSYNWPFRPQGGVPYSFLTNHLHRRFSNQMHVFSLSSASYESIAQTPTLCNEDVGHHDKKIMRGSLLWTKSQILLDWWSLQTERRWQIQRGYCWEHTPPCSTKVANWAAQAQSDHALTFLNNSSTYTAGYRDVQPLSHTSRFYRSIALSKELAIQPPHQRPASCR